MCLDRSACLSLISNKHAQIVRGSRCEACGCRGLSCHSWRRCARLSRSLHLTASVQRSGGFRFLFCRFCMIVKPMLRSNMIHKDFRLFLTSMSSARECEFYSLLFFGDDDWCRTFHSNRFIGSCESGQQPISRYQCCRTASSLRRNHQRLGRAFEEPTQVPGLACNVTFSKRGCTLCIFQLSLSSDLYQPVLRCKAMRLRQTREWSAKGKQQSSSFFRNRMLLTHPVFLCHLLAGTQLPFLSSLRHSLCDRTGSPRKRDAILPSDDGRTG